MSERKLASVQLIEQIEPIENADKIELVRIGAWKIIVPKNLYKINDKVIFFEIDSFIPFNTKLDPYIEHIKDRSKKKFKNTEGVLIKSIKLRGVYSQGFIVSLLDEYKDLKPETDLTDELKILKYVLPMFDENSKLSNFPYFLRKTDCERIQNIRVRDLDLIANKQFEITVKYDGTSFTGYVKDGVVNICSRNYLLDTESDNVYNKIKQTENIEQKLLDFYNKHKRNIAIQGEIIGPQIQKNPHKVNNNQLHIFNVYDIDKQCYCEIEDRNNIINELGLKHICVPSNELLPAPIYQGMKFIEFSGLNNFDINDSVENKQKILNLIRDYLIEVTEDFCSKKTQGIELEGIVLKSYDGSYIIKVINNNYIT